MPELLLLSPCAQLLPARATLLQVACLVNSSTGWVMGEDSSFRRGRLPSPSFQKVTEVHCEMIGPQPTLRETYKICHLQKMPCAVQTDTQIVSTDPPEKERLAGP